MKPATIAQLRKAVELLYPEPTEAQDALVELGVLQLRPEQDKMHHDDRCAECPSGDPDDGGDICCWHDCYDFTWKIAARAKL